MDVFKVLILTLIISSGSVFASLPKASDCPTWLSNSYDDYLETERSLKALTHYKPKALPTETARLIVEERYLFDRLESIVKRAPYVLTQPISPNQKSLRKVHPQAQSLAQIFLEALQKNKNNIFILNHENLNPGVLQSARKVSSELHLYFETVRFWLTILESLHHSETDYQAVKEVFIKSIRSSLEKYIAGGAALPTSWEFAFTASKAVDSHLGKFISVALVPLYVRAMRSAVDGALSSVPSISDDETGSIVWKGLDKDHLPHYIFIRSQDEANLN